MNRTPLVQALSLAGLALAAGAAHAAGFQLLEQNASGLGNAYAGSAAVADNASTVFFNPAGMTQLKEREASLGLTLVRPSFKFNDQGSSAGTLTAAGPGSDAGGVAALPNGYLSWGVAPGWRVGVGLGAPYGLTTEYDNPWVGGAQALKFDIKTYNVNPSVAWQVNEAWSVGFGVNWQKMEVEYQRLAGVSVPFSGIVATLKADNDAWGWNAGVRWAAGPATMLGLSYRSAIRHKLEGTLVAGPTNAPAQADVKLPDTAILSMVQRISPTMELLGDVSWTGWSSIPRVDIVAGGTTVQSLDTAFRDTWRLAWGLNLALNDAAKARFGVAYDQTPVPDAQHRLVSLPDNNRLWFTTGLQYKLAPAHTVDVGLAYIRVPKTPIDNDQALAGRGRVTGQYDANVWLLGAQYSVAF